MFQRFLQNFNTFSRRVVYVTTIYSTLFNAYGAVEKLVRQLSDGRVGWTKRSIKWLVCLTLPRPRVSEAQDHIILGLRR